MPADRNNSSVRMWKKAALGNCEPRWSFSIASEGMPCWARNMAVDRPTRPPPANTTGNSSSLIDRLPGDRAFNHKVGGRWLSGDTGGWRLEVWGLGVGEDL